jgi:2-polyprenyl-3-methyl-5-hydroxy-6-metoxy-1,4-benzoquinol methylase
MRAFYEAVWADAPAASRPWAWQRRHDLLLAEARPGERVLDAGCGSGHFSAALVAHGCTVVGTDIAERALERARETAPGAEFRLLEPDGGLPAGHGEFDLVWCSEVLEHVPDAGALLADIRRVLRPSGRLLLTTPGHGWLKRVLVAAVRFDAHFDPQGQHVRFYTARSLREHLAVTGFADVGVREVGGLPGLRETLVARALRA